MNRLKAFLIEEILMIVFIIFSELCISEYISAGKEVLTVMLVMGILVAIGKSVETIVDCSVCKNTNKKRSFARFKRMLVCFLISGPAFFAVFCLFFHVYINGALMIMYSIISASLAVIHLWISSAIDKLLLFFNMPLRDMITNSFEPVSDCEDTFENDQRNLE